MNTTYLRNKSFKLPSVTFTFLFLFSFFFSVSAIAAPSPNGNAHGFRALSGQSAENFSIPNDVVETRQRTLGPNLKSRHFNQYLGNAQVLGGQLTVYIDSQGRTISVIGGYYPDLLTTNDIKLTPASAKATVIRKIGGNGKWFNKLMVNPGTGRYFYMVESRRADSRWFYWIDAENGSVLNAYDGLTHSEGIGVLGDLKDLTGLTRPGSNGFELISLDGRIRTFDARSRNRLPGELATDDDDNWNTSGSTSPGQPALVDAHFYARVTDNYYMDTHGFNWLNEFPQGIVSSAHLKRNYNNAYWNGEQMAYGDGDGSTFIELSGDLDVVGHELSHGVTEATSNLIYQNESGALNEAFSDIMGTNIEYAYGSGNWTIGEDITVGTNGIRNMQDPGEDGDPSHYDERYTGTGDNGGVHINSGIANHWYYLLVVGGQNSDPQFASQTGVTGIGLEAAEQIAYQGFTALTATATFCDARQSTMAVAQSFSSNVGSAWDEVGVTDANCSNGGGGGGGGSGDAPVISNVSSQKLNGVKFAISWQTDIPADSEVIFTCCGTYSSSQLVTNHSMSFNGSKNASYEYFVRSTSEGGVTTTEGPFVHQN